MLVQLVVELRSQGVRRIQGQHAPKCFRRFLGRSSFEGRAGLGHCRVDFVERLAHFALDPERFRVVGVVGEDGVGLAQRGAVVASLEALQHELLLARAQLLAQVFVTRPAWNSTLMASPSVVVLELGEFIDKRRGKDLWTGAGDLAKFYKGWT